MCPYYSGTGIPYARRQAVRPLRKPLVAFTPKSLLRHKAAVSTLEELTEGSFQTIIADPVPDEKAITRTILCSGKVYYDLLEKQQAEALDHVALIRIEQLYPFPQDDLDAVLQCYPNLADVIWCQEEPMNQGAWYCSQHHFQRAVKAYEQQNQTALHFNYAGRAAQPACGYVFIHTEEQQQLVNDAFTV